MSRYVPILAGVFFLVSLTYVQIRITDRLEGSNVTAEELAERFEHVPKIIGDWQGEDKPVDENVKKMAGAIGAVSRDYRNSRTGERVELWLIVGHARDVSFHTPDLCYPGSGFEARAQENGKYPFKVEGQPETVFWTNLFYKEDVTGRTLRRVFWTWFNPTSEENQGKVVWEAAENPRRRFGNTRGLYKMYFTCEQRDPMEAADQSACLHFARDFLPEVNQVLDPAAQLPSADASGTAGAGQPAKAPVTAPADEPPAAPLAADPANSGAIAPQDGVAPATPIAAPAETPKAE